MVPVTLRISRREALTTLLATVTLFACSRRAGERPPTLAAARENTTLHPGDVIRMEIVGESDLPTEYQVASDGTITFPYVQTLEVAGLEPQALAERIRQALIDKKILQDPSVIVRVTEYRSKMVTVLGQVQKPGSFALSPGMTLIQAISIAGGFTAIAQKTRVNLSRISEGHAKTVVIDVESIYNGSNEDIALQSGDSIYVNERVF